MRHAKGDTWAGVDIINEGIQDNLKEFVWEPISVKVNAIQAATEAACLILSVDESISKFLSLFFFDDCIDVVLIT